jgi:hypothetical protein
MAVKLESTEVFNEPIDRLCENLLANLNKEDSGFFDTYWEAFHAEEFTFDNQRPVRLIWGATKAFYPYEHGVFHFLMKFTALSANGCQVDFVVGLPALALENDPELKERLYRGEYQNMQSLAEKVMELCVNPQAETNVGMINRFRKLLEGSKDKRKTGDDMTED